MDSRHDEDILTTVNLTWVSLTTLMLIAISYVIYRYFQVKKQTPIIATEDEIQQYEEWKTIVNKVTLPAAMINVAAFENNLKKLTDVVEDSNKINIYKKTIRLATHSIRNIALIDYTLRKYPELFQGLMCASVSEVAVLYNQLKPKGKGGNFLIAYPTVQPSDLTKLSELHNLGVKVALALDSLQQMEIVSQAMWGSKLPLPIVIKLALTIPHLERFTQVNHGGVKNLGQLSYILDQFIGAPSSVVNFLGVLSDLFNAFYTKPDKYQYIKIVGVLTHESILAELTDNDPHKSSFGNFGSWILRELSARYIAKTRAKIPEMFHRRNLKLEIFNGGCTGSIHYTAEEDSGLTELTFGNGLLYPIHCEYYSDLTGIGLQPSAYFARSISQVSENKVYQVKHPNEPVINATNTQLSTMVIPSYITCHNGHYLVTNESNRVVSPAGLETIKQTFGSIQTEFKVKKSIPLKSGDPVIGRPAEVRELNQYSKFLLFRHPKENTEQKPAFFKTYRI